MPVPKKMKSSFVDAVRLYLRGGYGGVGHPKYGGLGGSGGKIYVVGKDDPSKSFN